LEETAFRLAGFFQPLETWAVFFPDLGTFFATDVTEFLDIGKRGMELFVGLAEHSRIYLIPEGIDGHCGF